MNRRQRNSLVMGGTGLFFLAVTAVAWACTAQPQIQLSPAFAPPGGQIQLTGNSFGIGNVEVRWDGQQGEKLAEVPTKDGQFAVQITLPQVAPGVYTLYVTGPDLFGATPDGVDRYSYAGRDSVEVTDPTIQPLAGQNIEDLTGSRARSASSRAAVSSELWSGFSQTNSGPSVAAVSSESAAEQRSPSLMAGLALLGIGTLGLGGMAAVVRRRSKAERRL